MLSLKSSEHIILLMPGFAVDEQDTSCIAPVQMMALELSRIRGADAITIVAMHYPYVSSKYRWNGINVVAIGANNASFPKRLLYWRQLKRTLSFIAKEKGEVRIHSFWYSELAYLAEQWAKKNKTIHTVTLMGQEVKTGNKYISRAKVSSDRILSLSQFQSDMIEQNYQIKPAMNVCFGIDDAPIVQSTKKYDIIGVGSLVKVKNYEKFIQVIFEVKKSIPNLKVGIIGGGELMKENGDKANDLGLADNIEFSGLLNREASVLEISKAKLLLHTSDFESLGYVFLEAIMQKIAIVSTPVGIAPEVPEIRTGESVEELSRLVVERLQSDLAISYSKLPSVQKVTDDYMNFWKNSKK